MNPSDYRRLVDAGMTPDQIALVMEMFSARDEARKAGQRERWRKSQEKKRNAHVSSQELTLAHVSSREAPASRAPATRAEDNYAPARVEDNLSNSVELISDRLELVSAPSPKTAQAKRPSPTGSRIPDDYRPDLAAAMELGLSRARAESEAAKFCDYWRGVAGARGRKADWPATWRNWARRAADDAPPRAGPLQRPMRAADVLMRDVELDLNGHGKEQEASGFSQPVLRIPRFASG